MRDRFGVDVRKAGAVLVVLAFAVACGTKDGAANDTVPPADGGSGSANNVKVKGNPGMPGRPGDDPAATQKYLLNLGWGDNLPDSQVVDTVTIADGNSTALIRIVPNDTATTVDWEAATAGGNGYFVAKIYNLEDKPIQALGIPKLGVGYVWIGQTGNSATDRGIGIYSVKNNGKIEPNPKLMKGYRKCDTQHAYSGVKITDNKKCAGAMHGVAVTSNLILASMTNAAPPPPGGQGLWITCAGGCCEVSIF
jgi:hypothetical protein